MQENRNYTKHVFKGFFIIFSMTFLGAIAGYLFRLVLAKNLTVAQYGLFYSVYAILYLIFIMKDFGIVSAIVKYIPEFLVKKEYMKIKTTIVLSTAVVLVLGITLSIISVLFSKFIALRYIKDPSSTGFILVMIAVFFLFSFDNLETNLLASFQEHFLYALFQFLRQALPLVFIFFAFMVNKNINYIAYSLIATSLALGVYLLILIRKLIPGFYKIRTDVPRKILNGKIFKEKISKDLWKFGLSVVFVSIGWMILQYTDTLMITYFINTTASGIYNAAIPIANIFIYMSAALSIIIFPLTSELWAKKLKEKISTGLSMFYRYVLLLFLPFAIIIFSFSGTIISLLFTPEYKLAATALSILIIGTLLNFIAQINFSFFSGIGKPDIVAKLTLTAAIVNIIANFILIPMYGISGAAMATTGSYLLMVIISTLVMKKHITVNLPIIHWTKTIIISLLMLPLIEFLKTIIIIGVYYQAAIIICITAAVYLILSYLAGQISIDELKNIVKQVRL